MGNFGLLYRESKSIERKPNDPIDSAMQRIPETKSAGVFLPDRNNL